MKFQNVKKGDVVLVPVYVNYGFSKHRRFYIPDPVLRVTKTQLITESGRRFKKDGGSEVGEHFSNCYYEGEEIGRFGIMAEDQTKEMHEFKVKLNIEKKLIKKINGLKIKIGSGIDISDLQLIQEHLEAVRQIIDRNQKK